MDQSIQTSPTLYSSNYNPQTGQTTNTQTANPINNTSATTNPTNLGNGATGTVNQTTTQTGSNGEQYVVDASGKIVQGPSNGAYQVGSQYPTQNTSTITSTNSDQTNLDTANATRQTNQDAMVQAQKDFSDTINNIQNGTTPLSAGEQAQIDGLKNQFDTLIKQQTQTNTQASGVANIRGYQTGAAEYDPTFQVKTIGSIVSAGQAKIADLQIKEASAVAQLTQSLKDNDISKIKEAYDSLTAVQKDRAAEIQKTVDEANTKIKDAQAQQVAAQDFALKQKQYDLSAATNAIDAKYKAAEIAKIYNDMKTSDITGAQNWVSAIKSGAAKLSDVPANMKNAVAAGLANGGSSQTDMLQTTKTSLDTLKNMIDTNQGFSAAVGVKGLSSFFGLKGTPIAGSAAADFDAKLKQTVNDVVLPNLTILHGLGRVTDREFQALQSSITSLNTNLSEKEFKREFDSLYQTINDKIAQDTTHNGITLPGAVSSSGSNYGGITLPN